MVALYPSCKQNGFQNHAYNLSPQQYRPIDFFLDDNAKSPEAPNVLIFWIALKFGYAENKFISEPNPSGKGLVNERHGEDAQQEPSYKSFQHTKISRDTVRGNIAKTKCSERIKTERKSVYQAD